MHTANVPIDERGKVAIEAIKNATQLNGLHVVTINDITHTRDKHMSRLLPKWANAMRSWGKAGVVKEGKQ